MTAAQKIADMLLTQRTVDGHWAGELSASALSTATAVSTFCFYLTRMKNSADDGRCQQFSRLIDGGVRWLVQCQNQDGGWGDTDKNYSNIATTMLVVAALTAADRADHSVATAIRQRAQTYIQRAGGIAALRQRYGKDKTFAVPILANCAMAGIVSWREVSALPFEAACVPQRFYHLLQLPVVSYAIPALVAIGQCKFINDPPWDPVRKMIRKSAINRSLNLLKKMQPQSGGYLEAIPLTSFVSMALIESGRWDHPVVKNGIQFLTESLRAVVDGDGDDDAIYCWPIDTNLATWGTTLAINALANDHSNFTALVESEPDRWRKCFQWLLDCQNQTVHPFTGSPPGGWGWTDLTGSVPDADDTPGALCALAQILKVCRSLEPAHETFGNHFQQQIISSADAGIAWLLKLQNRDNGWPTFCRGWSNLPFDRSGSDLTAHVVRALSVWRGVPGLTVADSAIAQAINTGVKYLKKTQRPDGSWLPLWFGNQDQPDDINPFYGTAKVIQAFADLDLLDTHAGRIGLNWMQQNQNSDGGFGGGASVKYSDSSLGQSSVEETALCTDALLNSSHPAHRTAAQKGIHWLETAVDASAIETCHPIGFYFAKLWYYEKLYPIVFALSALAKFTREGR